MSGEHEWHVRGRQHRRKGIPGWATMETQEILRAGVKRPNGVVLARQWEIPIQGPAEYPPCEVPVDPYVYGAWLGDGVKAGGRITNMDPEVWAELAQFYEIGPDNAARRSRSTTRTLRGFVTDLKAHGLFGCTTYNARVDKRYMRSDARLAVFQGLMDTDGWVQEGKSAEFASASEQLVKDVVWIARSLGLKARNPTFKPNKCAGAWGTNISWDGKTPIFRLPRKQEKLARAEHRYQCRWIDSIESVGMADGMCIDVGGDGLYLTDDFHVTHNSTSAAWILHWLMSTRPHLSGVVTANTGAQLKTKTWRELAYWHKMSLHEHWFKWTATKFYHKDHEETWFCAAIPNSEENSEAFAGLHAKYVIVMYDEASAIPDKIWEVSEGATTTPRAMWLVYDNPTRNTGRFKACFTSDRDRWVTRKVDIRTCDPKRVSQTLIAEWAEAYGADSDFFRVRVLGEFPNASDMQFIAEDKVEMAQARELTYEQFGFLPLIMGIDIARGGDEDLGGGDYGGDLNVIALRRGRKLEELIEFPGRSDLVKVAKRIQKEIDERRPAIVFCDAVGNASGVPDMLASWGYQVVRVNSRKLPDDEEVYYDKRMEMWDRMREWINTAEIPDDKELREELTAAQFGHARHQKRGEVLILEQKKHIRARLGRSTDKADALAHTFYHKIAGGHDLPAVGETFSGMGSVEPSDAWI